MMIFSLRKMIQRAKFLVLFVVLTYILYHALSVLTAWLEPGHRYRQPAGAAVKAFRQESAELESGGIAERLKLFYWYGE